MQMHLRFSPDANINGSGINARAAEFVVRIVKRRDIDAIAFHLVQLRRSAKSRYRGIIISLTRTLDGGVARKLRHRTIRKARKERTLYIKRDTVGCIIGAAIKNAAARESAGALN